MLAIRRRCGWRHWTCSSRECISARDWSEARDVGRKAVAVNVADIEAIGAQGNGSAGRLLRAGRPVRGLGAAISPMGSGKKARRPVSACSAVM